MEELTGVPLAQHSKPLAQLLHSLPSEETDHEIAMMCFYKQHLFRKYIICFTLSCKCMCTCVSYFRQSLYVFFYFDFQYVTGPTTGLPARIVSSAFVE